MDKSAREWKALLIVNGTMLLCAIVVLFFKGVGGRISFYNYISKEQILKIKQINFKENADKLESLGFYVDTDNNYFHAFRTQQIGNTELELRFTSKIKETPKTLFNNYNGVVATVNKLPAYMNTDNIPIYTNKNKFPSKNNLCSINISLQYQGMELFIVQFGDKNANFISDELDKVLTVLSEGK